eukprot:c55170_g1_i1 orf=127-546(+)
MVANEITSSRYGMDDVPTTAGRKEIENTEEESHRGGEDSQALSNIFPQETQSEQQNAEDEREEPVQCKNGMYVRTMDDHHSGPMRTKATISFAHQLSPLESMDHRDRVYSSAWEEANDRQEHSGSMAEKVDSARIGEPG